jgi:hypothetical protein
MIFSFFSPGRVVRSFYYRAPEIYYYSFFFLYIFVLPVSWFVRREPIISLLMTAAVYTTI